MDTMAGFFSQFTPEQMRAQYAKNLEQLRGMLAEAQKVAPRKYRGFTVEYLTAKVAEYERLANVGR